MPSQDDRVSQILRRALLTHREVRSESTLRLFLSWRGSRRSSRALSNLPWRSSSFARRRIFLLKPGSRCSYASRNLWRLWICLNVSEFSGITSSGFFGLKIRAESWELFLRSWVRSIRFVLLDQNQIAKSADPSVSHPLKETLSKVHQKEEFTGSVLSAWMISDIFVFVSFTSSVRHFDSRDQNDFSGFFNIPVNCANADARANFSSGVAWSFFSSGQLFSA